MSHMDVIQLNEYLEKPGRELAARLINASKNPRPALILDGDDVVGTFLAPEPSEKELTRRLLNHLTSDRLDSLIARLGEENPD